MEKWRMMFAYMNRISFLPMGQEMNRAVLKEKFERCIVNNSGDITTFKKARRLGKQIILTMTLEEPKGFSAERIEHKIKIISVDHAPPTDVLLSFYLGRMTPFIPVALGAAAAWLFLLFFI